ncbi:MAG TPA: hypothetical protein VMF55_01220 [Solirubrobacterales bacterium]|nr:hypothetical protein [Solirubrobacterales bacterium]
MGVGNPGSRIGAPALALLIAAVLCAAVVGEASGALVGKNGRVYACYKAKGKHKGAVRLVAKSAHCRKGEKKVSWSVTGPSGENGSNGENGTPGEGGAGGEKGAAATQGLEKQVQALTTKVTSLESVLKGITNTELLGALSKLQGISGTQLQEAVASIADVKALCSQASVLTEQANKLGSLFGGIELGGTIPALLKLVVPTAPPSLAPFGC